jgi:ADP-ribose pyrophosphatase
LLLIQKQERIDSAPVFLIYSHEKASIMKFELITSEPRYQGRAFNIRRDHVLLPNGRDTHLDIVEHIGSTIIVPMDTDGLIYFVRQYRHAAQMDMLELPAGTLEVGEDPMVCAQREVREETGMAAGKIKEIGGFYLAPGYSTEFMHVYLATELTPDPLEADADEFLSVETMSLAKAMKLAETGELPDAKTLAALLLAKAYLPSESR